MSREGGIAELAEQDSANYSETASAAVAAGTRRTENECEIDLLRGNHSTEAAKIGGGKEYH